MSEKVINEKALLENIAFLKRKGGFSKFCAVVKAGAYGHCVENIVPLLKGKVDYFAVATFREALEVKKLDNDAKILVLSPEVEKKIKDGIELTVARVGDVLALEKLRKRVFVHLKINTGMNRLKMMLRRLFHWAEHHLS